MPSLRCLKQATSTLSIKWELQCARRVHGVTCSSYHTKNCLLYFRTSIWRNVSSASKNVIKFWKVYSLIVTSEFEIGRKVVLNSLGQEINLNFFESFLYRAGSACFVWEDVRSGFQSVEEMPSLFWKVSNFTWKWYTSLKMLLNPQEPTCRRYDEDEAEPSPSEGSQSSEEKSTASSVGSAPARMRPTTKSRLKTPLEKASNQSKSSALPSRSTPSGRGAVSFRDVSKNLDDSNISFDATPAAASRSALKEGAAATALLIAVRSIHVRESDSIQRRHLGRVRIQWNIGSSGRHHVGDCDEEQSQEGNAGRQRQQPGPVLAFCLREIIAVLVLWLYSHIYLNWTLFRAD